MPHGPVIMETEGMNSTYLAIGTTDGVSVCDHLARSAAFLVFELERGEVKGCSERSRQADGCGNHRSFTDLLEGCQAVICGGIGQGAFDALTRFGVQPIVISQPMSVDDALRQYLAGSLRVSAERVCLCH
jgi:predicted Fe-Mo cluster-binding NifX family protein